MQATPRTSSFARSSTRRPTSRSIAATHGAVQDQFRVGRIWSPAYPPTGLTLSDRRNMELTALCRSCGLCCDGSLFGRVRLEPGEVDSARRRRLHVVANGRSFEEPCTALVKQGEHHHCSIYADRPEPVVDSFASSTRGTCVMPGCLTSAWRWSAARGPFSRFSRKPDCGRTTKTRTPVSKPGCPSFVS